ncbi:methyltransferase-like 26 isoform X2 [Halictus rubicundus]|uniref:methyltransferase-like 26 isoform X2 n=1 Tax=Halictus rubicundus TaxID=77578 RepID=UPI004036D1B1
MNTVIHSAAYHRTGIMATKKLIYPAADRNKDPILSVLKKYVQHGPDKIFLEVSSGSGQHVAHFAPHFPQITFYPSEYEPELLDSISAYANEFVNIKPPLRVDITNNFRNWDNGKLLKDNGLLITYGPYAVDGKITPKSNVNFDKSLKLLDPSLGLRDIKDLKRLAEENGIKLINIVDMPANNKTIIWKKC